MIEATKLAAFAEAVARWRERKGIKPLAPESVAKSGGARLVEIAKAKAAKHRLIPKIEEVSLVDAPACPGALVVLKKNGPHPLVRLAMARREAGR